MAPELGANHIFFAYPADIRKVFYTTNTIESLNMSLRKVTKTRGSFPNDEAMFKRLYLALNNLTKKWTKPIRDGKLHWAASPYSLKTGCPNCDRNHLHKVIYTPLPQVHFKKIAGSLFENLSRQRGRQHLNLLNVRWSGEKH
jgi:hypothetical protein